MPGRVDERGQVRKLGLWRKSGWLLEAQHPSSRRAALALHAYEIAFWVSLADGLS